MNHSNSNSVISNYSNYKDYLETDWNANRNRILLFADIMGFKELVKTKQHSDLVLKFRKFINELTMLMEPLETGKHLRLTMFSDSIIIGTDSCTIKNFNIIVKAAALLMNLCYEHSLPINGCISCGSLTFDEQSQSAERISETKGKRKIQPYMPLFIGDSVVNAHILNEDLFCYGIVLHPSAESLFKESTRHLNKKFHHPFRYIPIPMKSGGHANLYYLLWTDVSTPLTLKGVSLMHYIEWLKDLEQSKATSRPRTYIYHTLEICKLLLDIHE